MARTRWQYAAIAATVSLSIAACSDNTSWFKGESEAVDSALNTLVSDLDLRQDPRAGRNLPQITDPLPQLGRDLFFTKALGGGMDSACVTCHHPSLGGADALSFSVGVGAVNPDLLGEGRVHGGGLPLVPRNAPTVFNLGLWDTGLFWDSRVESLGKTAGANGAGSGIRTPDTLLGTADPGAGPNLASAQAHFPVTSAEEMRTSAFENGSSNEDVRSHLAARVGNYGIGAGELATNTWLPAFQAAFSSTDTAENLITFDNIAEAIGEYERSMVFVNSPWQRFLDGDTEAMTQQQKEGALLFFTRPGDGGAGCAACHSGPLFSNGMHTTVAFPQIGPGKGDGPTTNDDFGRERETGNPQDRYRFRVPSLLNIEMTAPYGHAGAYATLEEVVRHYDSPQRTVDTYFANGGWCQQDQFRDLASCASLYPDAVSNTQLALDKLRQEQRDRVSLFGQIDLEDAQVDQLVAFMQALTDPCVTDRSCLDPWIANNASSGHDGIQLNAVDEAMNPL